MLYNISWRRGGLVICQRGVLQLYFLQVVRPLQLSKSKVMTIIFKVITILVAWLVTSKGRLRDYKAYVYSYMLGKGSTIHQLYTESAYSFYSNNCHSSVYLFKKLAYIISLVLLESDFLDDLSHLIKLGHEETCLAHENRVARSASSLHVPLP